MTAKDLGKQVSDLNSRMKSIQEKIESDKIKNVVGTEMSKYFETHRVGPRSNSDEQKLLASFGCKSLPDLLTKVNPHSERFKHVPIELKAQVQNLKSDIENARWMSQMHYGEPLDRGDMWAPGAVSRVKGILENEFAKTHDLSAKIKSFDSSADLTGGAWVPTTIPSRFLEEFELERKLPGLFPERQMDSKNWNLPVQTDVQDALLIDEGGSLSDSNFETTDIPFSAVKLGKRTLIPEELNEDSAPDILRASRVELMRAQERAVEKAMLDGDKSPTHQDSDVTAANDARKAWDGLRKSALDKGATIDFGGSAATLALLDSMRKAGGKYFNNPTQLAYIFGARSYIDAVNIEQVTTVEKYGGQATILNGALGVLRGISVLTSEFVREDLNAAGVHDGTTTDFTYCLLVNVNEWMKGRRRPIRMKVTPDPRAEFDRWQLVSYQRLDFRGREQVIANQISTVMGLNMAV